MSEYVLFVILIFIPIGLMLYYFLRREGLPKKDIGIVLLLALLIIFSFPICMVRLGIYLSMLIYLLIIGALVVYLLRGEESPYLETAFASLRNLRQRPELIISTQNDLTVLNYEQLSEIPVDKPQQVVGQVMEGVLREEGIEIQSEDIEQAAALDMAGEPKLISTELEPARGINEKGEELIHSAEFVADELVEGMVARLAAKIENMPETASQVRNTEVLAEEQAELAFIVEKVKDVITGAAVRVENVHVTDMELIEDIVEEGADQAEAETAPVQEIIEEITVDEPETVELPEQTVPEAEMAVITEEVEAIADLELIEDIAEEGADQAEAETAPAQQIMEEITVDEPEVVEIPEQPVPEAEIVVVTEEVEAIADLELVEDIAEEGADQAEAETAPVQEIIEEITVDEPETEELPEQTVPEAEMAVVTEEVEAIADLEPVEDIAEVDGDQVEAETVSAQQIIEEITMDEPEAVEIPEQPVPEAEIVVVTEEVATIADLELVEDIAEEGIDQAEAETAPVQEIIEEIIVDEPEAVEIPESVIVREETVIIAAADIEFSEETLSTTEDIKLEVFAAEDIDEEEAVQVIEEVSDLPATPSSLVDIADLPEEDTGLELSEAVDEQAMSGEVIREETEPGEIAAEAFEQPAVEGEEANERSVAPETETQLTMENTPPETDIAEAGVASPEPMEVVYGAVELALISADLAEVNRLVDVAFHYKTRGDVPAAIEAFVGVWNKVESDELRYLITLELVDLYKECGYYNYAEQVLGNYLELGGHKSDIIYEINRQLNAIRFLATELTRLGMSGAPWAQVPRWIRMELEDALNH